MGKLLAELFKDNDYEPIIYQNKKIQQSLNLPIRKDQLIQVTFIKNNDLTVGGIGVSVDRRKGSILCEGDESSIERPVFWFDTAPKEFTFQCITKEDEGHVRIWNIWKNIKYQNTEAWTGNAGIYVEEINSNEFIMHCSSGNGEIDFEKLVVGIQLVDGK